MLIVRGTKKLRDRVKTAVPPEPNKVSTTELGDWFVNALFWTPQVALLVNARTFLPVFMPLAPASTLLERIPAAIAEVLQQHGVPALAINAEQAAMSDVRLAPTNDRRVLGVMNKYVHVGERLHPDRIPDLVALSVHLSQMFLKPLQEKHGTPATELASVFGQDAKIIPFPLQRVDHGIEAAATTGQVHHLKITLRNIRPPIWRRVMVDGSETLDHLHDVIQAAFGWYNAHLHEFEIDGTCYGVPDEDDWTPVLDERNHRIDQVAGAKKIVYTYDFGDNWEHDVVIEKTFGRDTTDAPTDLPVCLDGRRSGPPEDCGGPWGYAELLQVLGDPQHDEHARWLEWLGEPFDSEAFDTSDFANDLKFVRMTRFADGH